MRCTPCFPGGNGRHHQPEKRKGKSRGKGRRPGICRQQQCKAKQTKVLFQSPFQRAVWSTFSMPRYILCIQQQIRKHHQYPMHSARPSVDGRRQDGVLPQYHAVGVHRPKSPCPRRTILRQYLHGLGRRRTTAPPAPRDHCLPSGLIILVGGIHGRSCSLPEMWKPIQARWYPSILFIMTVFWGASWICPRTRGAEIGGHNCYAVGM